MTNVENFDQAAVEAAAAKQIMDEANKLPGELPEILDRRQEAGEEVFIQTEELVN